jgi:hypothetical protein
MAIRDINTLKSWYQTQDKPSQEQFWDWIDSFRHRSELIGMVDLTEEVKSAINNISHSSGRPQRLVTAGDDITFTMLAEYRLTNIWFNNKSGADMTLTISSPAGVIQDNILVEAAKQTDETFNLTFVENTDITISGVIGELVVLIDRR